MIRVQQLEILIGLGLAIVLVVAVAGGFMLLTQTEPQPAPVPTVAAATATPNPELQTRVPLCQDVLGSALEQQGWPSAIDLDPQQAVLTVQIDRVSSETGDIPAGQIWGVFETTLVAQEAGCTGYDTLVVWVGEFKAEVGIVDLLAWQSGQIDDGVFSTRVTLTR